MKCRFCASDLELPLVDLGSAPPSNAYLTEAAMREPESWFPLRVLVCENCWLVQTEDFARAEDLFNADYAYFSSISKSWLAHSERYVSDMASRMHLDNNSHVIEVAANDGYLLQYVRARGIPCTGIEPTAGTAAVAREQGIAVVEAFFGRELAARLAHEGKQADLMIANNVLAHVPDINDFVAGFALLLKPQGIATFEFPHLLRLMEESQFDTIYHEHFSYLSLTVVRHVFAEHGLSVFDVEEIATHGGSLRVYAQPTTTGQNPISNAVHELLDRETMAGMSTADYYGRFQARADRIKNDFLGFLLEARLNGKRVAAYGAAAKGNTLLNYAGVRPDLLQFVVDNNPAKQGKYMPGSRIPIVAESRIREAKPDYVVILPWNLGAEIRQQLGYIREWSGHFVTAVPELRIESSVQ